MKAGRLGYTLVRKSPFGVGPIKIKSSGNLVVSKMTKDSPGQVIFGEVDNIGRPTGMTATLTKDMIGTGSKARQSIAPSGFAVEKGKIVRYQTIPIYLGKTTILGGVIINRK